MSSLWMGFSPRILCYTIIVLVSYQNVANAMKTKSLAANFCRRYLICRREPQASRTGDRKKKTVNFLQAWPKR